MQTPLSKAELARRHRRQVLAQIWLPLGGSLVIALGLAVLAIFGTVNQSSEINRWGNISAIMMIIPNLLTSLVGLIALLFIIRGVQSLYRNLPRWMAKLQLVFVRITALTRNLTNRLVSPVISINTTSTKIGTFRKKILG